MHGLISLFFNFCIMVLDICLSFCFISLLFDFNHKWFSFYKNDIFPAKRIPVFILVIFFPDIKNVNHLYYSIWWLYDLLYVCSCFCNDRLPDCYCISCRTDSGSTEPDAMGIHPTGCSVSILSGTSHHFHQPPTWGHYLALSWTHMPCWVSSYSWYYCSQ